MKITVINGTEKHGVTYKMKEIFLEEFRNDAEITEYYLPKDCPNFCVGCTTCFLKDEHLCKDAEYIQKIEKSLLEADLLVFTSPAYVYSRIEMTNPGRTEKTNEVLNLYFLRISELQFYHLLTVCL